MIELITIEVDYVIICGLLFAGMICMSDKILGLKRSNN